MAQGQGDWLDRVTIPDMYPRKYDPFRPPQVTDTGVLAPVLPGAGSPATNISPDGLQTTQPGQRPSVYQRALNFQLSVGVTSVAFVQQRLEVDAMLIDVPSTALNSVWLGYGSGVQVGTGVEIQPGTPFFFSPTNTRELWELQRVFEYLTEIMGGLNGITPLPVYKAPRVVLDASNWFLIASATTTVTGLLFLIPEQQ